MFLLSGVTNPATPARTIAGLRLDLDAARKGHTWLLLPEGFREQPAGAKYPLPTHSEDIKLLVAIHVPPGKKDTGCTYLRRAFKRHKDIQARKQSAGIRIDRQEHEAKVSNKSFQNTLKTMEADAQSAVDDVREKATQAIASMSSLFSLGRQGMEGMMKAHLAEETWKGEKVSGGAFRQCFRMVTQTVKALGLPSDQRPDSRQAVLDEVAASVSDTRDAVAQAPGSDDETEH